MSRLKELIDKLCPDGVEYRTLGEVAPFVRERANTGEAQFDAYVGVDALLQDKMGRDATKTDIPDGRHIYFKPGDTLLGNIRPYLKKVWFADCPGGTNGDVLVFRAKEGIDPKYLFYVISSDDFFIYDNGKAKGSKMPRGDKEAIRKYRLPVPPIEVQREIVHILDSFQELDDALTAEIEAREKQLEAVRDYYFGRDKDYSQAVVRLGSVVKQISSGKTKQRLDDGPYVVYGSTGPISYCDAPSYKGRKILIARVGANCGFVHLAEGEYGVTDNTLVLSIKDEINIDYMFNQLVFLKLNSLAVGGGQPLITGRVLKDVSVIMPPRSVQDNIASCLSEFDATIRSLSRERDLRRRQASYYRDRLLCFSEKVS